MHNRPELFTIKTKKVNGGNVNVAAIAITY